MPWDVFISHASEEKDAVALPLKAALEDRGVSVWIDKGQIVGGQGLRASIDHGLKNTRFAVIIASTPFFEKHWTGRELDAIFGQEAGEKRDRLIPVLYNMAHSDVTKQSPLVAGRLMLNWADGVDAVADSIQSIVRGEMPVVPPKSVPATAAKHPNDESELRSLVLLLADDGRAVPVRSNDIRHDAGNRQLELHVKIEHPDASDFFASLSRSHRASVSVAYGLHAQRGTIESIHQSWSDGTESWRMTLRLVDTSANVMSEMSVNGVSPNEIAERRARRILLDERPTTKPTMFSNDSLLESMVGRTPGGLIQIDRSPFFKMLTGKVLTTERIAVAKLQAVVLLVLSNTVEHIHTFEAAARGDDRVAVSFRGRRPRVYTNVDPAWIDVQGECPLRE